MAPPPPLQIPAAPLLPEGGCAWTGGASASPQRPATPALPPLEEAQPAAAAWRRALSAPSAPAEAAAPEGDGDAYLRSLLIQLGVPAVGPASPGARRPASPSAAAAGPPAPPASPADSDDCCVVCWEGAKDVVLLPCKHMALCLGCARGVAGAAAAQRRSCPLCRAEVSERAQQRPARSRRPTAPSSCARCAGPAACCWEVSWAACCASSGSSGYFLAQPPPLVPRPSLLQVVDFMQVYRS